MKITMNKSKGKDLHGNLAKKYQKKTPIEHILDRPDTYIGSVGRSEVDLWVYNMIEERMEKRRVEMIQGLYKIFDEILVNASDHSIRLKADSKRAQVSLIKVVINRQEGYISVMNSGEGVPVALHPEHSVYIPELIFGHLLTSENYDDDEKRIVGGKNGLGAKLTNIYSTRFVVETVDAITKQKYMQEFRNNMGEKDAPKITKVAVGVKPYTQITFYPDLKRFGLEAFDDDIVDMMAKRVYDLTACTDKTVAVYLNDVKLECKSLEHYVDYYIGTDKTVNPRIYESVGERWEVAVALSNDDEFEQMSFVNGIYTYKGGKHVDYVATHIANRLSKYLGERRTKMDIKAEYIKKNMWLFLRCSIENPSFDSQTKEFMTTPSKSFGSLCKVSDKFIEKLAKIGIVERCQIMTNFKSEMLLAKKDIKNNAVRRTRLTIPKLDDAEIAGTSRSSEATLFICEGDSAKSLVVAGLATIGQEKYGVFPIRGKLLNTREATLKQMMENAEINNLQKILGLQRYEYSSEKKSPKKSINDGDDTASIENGGGSEKGSAKRMRKIYTSTKELRYGKVLILTDSDVDGAHIKGLLMNFIHSLWPELTKIPDFIVSLATPIVKVKKGKTECLSFYTVTDYENWKENVGDDISHWSIKYYKGLGTSSNIEAREYFTDIDTKLISYQNKSEECDKAITLAFAKEQADGRKQWLKEYDPQNIIEQSEKDVSMRDFVYRELIHFSDYDCKRSIPSMCDGLKPGQRKIIFTVLKRNFKKEIKVSELGGATSLCSAYHHGEASLQKTIIGLAQNFVGSNNINLLFPSGQFGTRTMGGEDAASPRYIFTYMTELMPIIFNKLDAPMLHFLNDDGKKIEPEYYLPILPMTLINGARGIGTGYSTYEPCYNPKQIIEILEQKMANKEIDYSPENLKPWYRGFRGTIDYNESKGNYLCRGVYKFVDNTHIEITELPIEVWTEDYKEMLNEFIIDKSVSDEKKKAKQCITDYKNVPSNSKVNFIITMPAETLNQYKENTDKFEKDFKLVSGISINNMHLYSPKGCIKKYNNVGEIIDEFYQLRLALYVKRKIYWMTRFKKELDIILSKVRFIEYVRSGKINIRNDEVKVIAQLEEFEFPKFSLKNDDKGKNDNDGEVEGEDADTEDNNKFSYEYLLRMHIRSLTENMMNKLRGEYELRLADYKEFEAKSEEELWRDDLAIFKAKYTKMMDEYEAERAEEETIGNKNSSAKGKGNVKKAMIKKIKVLK